MNRKEIKYYESQSALWYILAYSRNWRKLMKWLVSGQMPHYLIYEICSMYVTGLPSQDGRIAPRLTACVTSLCRTFQSYSFKLYFFHGISVPLSIQAVKFLMQRSRSSQHSFQVKVYKRSRKNCHTYKLFERRGFWSTWKFIIFRNLPKRRLWKMEPWLLWR